MFIVSFRVIILQGNNNFLIFHNIYLIDFHLAAKYCSLVEAEGGIEKLNKLLADDRPYNRIKSLALSVILNCSPDNPRGEQQEALQSSSEYSPDD